MDSIFRTSEIFAFHYFRRCSNPFKLFLLSPERTNNLFPGYLARAQSAFSWPWSPFSWFCVWWDLRASDASPKSAVWPGAPSQKSLSPCSLCSSNHAMRVDGAMKKNNFQMLTFYWLEISQDFHSMFFERYWSHMKDFQKEDGSSGCFGTRRFPHVRFRIVCDYDISQKYYFPRRMLFSDFLK